MSDKQIRILASLCIVAAIVVIVAAVIFGDGGGGEDLTVVDNPAIESISPERGDEVLQQASVELDLAPGYEGTIIRINDIEIPATEVVFDETRNIVSWDPGPGSILASLLPEQNCVTANYWLKSEGPGVPSVFTWCFTAA